MMVKSRLESEMRTASRRERRFVQKRARRTAESTVARPQGACWVRAAHQKHWFFIGERGNAHRVQARAHFFSKCTPCAGESSILSTQDGAHDHVSKQNVHRAEAGAPFSIKGAPCARERSKSVPTKRRRCSRCGGAHPTSFSLDPPDVRGAWQGAAE